jgi:replicative DNA helicase
MKSEKNTIKYRLNVDEWQQLGIRQLLANLCYVDLTPEQIAEGWQEHPVNRLAEMGEYKITSEMIELTGMADEANFMRAVESLLSNNKVPYFDAVRETLAYIVKSRERAEEIVKGVKAHRTVDESIHAAAFAIGQHMKTEYLAYLLRELAMEEVLGPYGNYEEKYERVIDRLAAVAPVSRQRKRASYDYLWYDIQDYAREAVQRRKAGKSMGPQYPWKTLKKLVRGGMEKGDLHLWTGGTKAGKTTFASAIGRHIAFTQPEYMVLMLHLETSHLTLAAREVCVAFNVQVGDIREGLIDPDDDYWSPKFKAMEDKIARKCGAGEEGRYIYENCPGLTITEMEAYVAEYAAKAEARGLELVVILDYYQEMGWEDLKGVQNETQALNILATKLKTLADDYGIYLIVFAQEADDDNGSKRTTPYMAKKIVKRAQAHFRILRGGEDGLEIAKFDLAVPTYDANGDIIKDDFGHPVPKLDGLRTDEYPIGRPMYWQRANEPTAYTRIWLCRGNNVGLGIQYVNIANGYFSIKEAAPPSVS